MINETNSDKLDENTENNAESSSLKAKVRDFYLFSFYFKKNRISESKIPLCVCKVIVMEKLIIIHNQKGKLFNKLIL